MSAIQGKTDVENTFLSRREITCDFNGLGGSAPSKTDAKEKDAAPKTEEKPKEGKTDAPANDDKKSKDEKSSKEGSS